MLAIVGASDATVIVAAIGGATVLLAEMLRRQSAHQKKAVEAADRAVDAAQTAALSIGDANGHGSVHETLATLLGHQAEIRARIDTQDEARQAGQKRQLEIQEAMFNVQDMVMTMRASLIAQTSWQVTHTDEDAEAFSGLRECVDHLRALLGEPEDGEDFVPLIATVQALKQDLVADAERVNAAQGLLVGDAIQMIEEARARLDELDARYSKETP